MIAQRALCLMTCLMATAGIASAQSFVFHVNSSADVVDAVIGDHICETAPGNGVCTLRAAIQEANATTVPDVILLPASVYTLTIPGRAEDAAAAGDLDITTDLTILGEDAASTIHSSPGLASSSVSASVRVTDVPSGLVTTTFHAPRARPTTLKDATSVVLRSPAAAGAPRTSGSPVRVSFTDAPGLNPFP